MLTVLLGGQALAVLLGGQALAVLLGGQALIRNPPIVCANSRQRERHSSVKPIQGGAGQTSSPHRHRVRETDVILIRKRGAGGSRAPTGVRAPGTDSVHPRDGQGRCLPLPFITPTRRGSPPSFGAEGAAAQPHGRRDIQQMQKNKRIGRL